MDVEEAVQLAKVRLQRHQDRIWEGDEDAASKARLSQRAEADALWAALEAVAKAVNGQEITQVRDYYRESRR